MWERSARRSRTTPITCLGPDDLKPRLRIDGCLGFRDINGDFAGEMAMLAPFGTGNPRPLFEARGVEVVDGPRRLKDKHLKMALKQNGRIFRAIAWRAVEREQFITDNRASLDLAFSLEHNRYQGNEYLELSVSDVRATARCLSGAVRPGGVDMVSWQKRARLVVLAVAVGVVAVVFLTTRRREEPPPPAPIERGDPAATIESSGAFIVQVKGERETVRVEAEKQYSYPDGSTRLIKAKVTSVRQGKTFVATGDEARVGENQTNLDMKGNVVMTSSDGLEAKGSSAAYSQSEGIVRAPGPVTFKRGRMSGSGVDFSYDEARDLMGLSDQIEGEARAAKRRAARRPTSRPAPSVLARTDKFVSFERAVHIVRGSQVIDADSALGDLTENEEHLTRPRAAGQRAHRNAERAARRAQVDVGRRHQPDVLRKHRPAAERDRHRRLARCGLRRRRTRPKACSTPTTSRSAWRPTARR